MTPTGLPDFIVIGGARCGTTSLHYYLGLHPEICVFREKEPNFFYGEENWEKGLEWYRAGFRTSRPVKARGEISPGYTGFPVHPGVPKRMHAVVPDAKLIYIVRDPLERMISHYINSLDSAIVPEGLADAVRNLETSRYVLSSRQCFQLEQYLPYYPLSRILILTRDQFARQRRDTLAQIFRFIGVDDSYWDDRFSQEFNGSKAKRSKNALGRLLIKLIARRGRRINPRIGAPLRNLVLAPFSRKIEPPKLDPELRAQLLEIFREDTGRLRRLTGLPLEGWSV